MLGRCRGNRESLLVPSGLWGHQEHWRRHPKCPIVLRHLVCVFCTKGGTILNRTLSETSDVR